MTWLNLAGFALRPGYGFVNDQARIDALWPLYANGLFHKKEKRCLEQWWITWRRVAGGLSSEQQLTIYLTESKLLKSKDLDTKELIRLLASLERLPEDHKVDFSQLLITQMQSMRKIPVHYSWALARIGNRALLCRETNYVLPPSAIERWFELFKGRDWNSSDCNSLCSMFIQTARLVGDDKYNLSPSTREEIVEKLKESGCRSEKIKPLSVLEALKSEERESLFGEKLPSGLYL